MAVTPSRKALASSGSMRSILCVKKSVGRAAFIAVPQYVSANELVDTGPCILPTWGGPDERRLSLGKLAAGSRQEPPIVLVDLKLAIAELLRPRFRCVGRGGSLALLLYPAVSTHSTYVTR